MRAVKIAIGILCGGLAALLVCCALLTAARASPDDQPRWQGPLITLCLAGALGCGAYLLIRKPRDPLAEIHCARCLTLGGHTPEPSHGDDHLNPLVAHLGGFALPVLFLAGKAKRFRCGQCSELFYAAVPGTIIYRMIFLFLLAVVVVPIVAQLVIVLRGQ